MATKPSQSWTVWINVAVVIASAIAAAFATLPQHWQEAPVVAAVMGIVNLILRFKTGFGR